MEVALEPMGFTGKEGDDEVGLVYFGERYLMPHLGRWASLGPLQVPEENRWFEQRLGVLEDSVP